MKLKVCIVVCTLLQIFTPKENMVALLESFIKMSFKLSRRNSESENNLWLYCYDLIPEADEKFPLQSYSEEESWFSCSYIKLLTDEIKTYCVQNSFDILSYVKVFLISNE